MKKALIFYGGWEGHSPEETTHIYSNILKAENFEVKATNTLTTLEEEDLNNYDLIIPNWTQGTITQDQLKPLMEAVKNGTGLAGLHGGLGDSFRWETEYQFMVGGQWVAHPGNEFTTYEVNIVDSNNPLTKGIKDFTVTSEQYYMHVDPVVKVYATTKFPVADGPHTPNGEVIMPVVWTKMWGNGKVYYCSLGHTPEIVRMPEVIELIRNGFRWASR